MILPGDPLEDALASAPLETVLRLAVRRADEMLVESAADFDGPPTERDLNPPRFDTWAPSTAPTLLAVYSRDAA